ncbi:MAG: threonine--tRNA ligase [Clostridia bacterium]|nr:threonine--tRNA ligase [Clostridia bacterium]MBR2972881.1 threonine--tRNA ligase [Clostridia bacterium]MBR3576659.1 threonine--tRNA ligase [Clostridia bacterium]
MINVTLKSGDVMTFENPTSVYDIAKTISEGLARAATCAEVNGQTVDLRTIVTTDCTLNILTFTSDEGAAAYRHTTSHILAQAVKRLFPETKLAIGPAIDNGFYYDFDADKAFTPEDLENIEKEMAKIIKENLAIERFELSRAEALKLMEDLGEPYKVELIQDLPEDATLSFYKQGDFTDLCAGPHLMTTGGVKAVKLTSVAGAYWRGNENNKMLQRIYGTSFPKKAELEEHLERLEEAKKRDHNKLGRELGIFTTSELIGQGLPILLPKGAKIMQILQRFVEDHEDSHGWVRTKTPYMAKSDLYKVSGHWDHYQDGMFVMGDEAVDKEVFALRPMTCPFQYQAYLAQMRSYRDLPLRYGETSTLFRNEASGEMHGLIRVRQFTISEGHLMCRPDQLEEEFKNCLEMAIYMLKTLGLYEDVSYRFSQWDPDDRDKYIGTPEQWDEAQSTMAKILEHLNIPHKIGIGEAAFYGPKLDIQIKNVHGKEDTLITIQIDQMLAEKFGMEYTDSDGTKKNPYIIHRTSIGCYERTLALLIEKYAGAFPVWLAPTQVEIIPISDKHLDFAYKVKAELEKIGVRLEIDSRAEKMGYKIREAQLAKIPYMLVMGDKEVENGEVAIRKRGEGDIGTMKIEDFVKLIKEDIDTRVIW